mmetsp:Transcript_80314/g.260261  ORF Transcript_80314/g.260261 Transcript_80314/m.260261 type:complete len:255 (+) Transcript_80314:355-1119(+)
MMMIFNLSFKPLISWSFRIAATTFCSMSCCETLFPRPSGWYWAMSSALILGLSRGCLRGGHGGSVRSASGGGLLAPESALARRLAMPENFGAAPHACNFILNHGKNSSLRMSSLSNFVFGLESNQFAFTWNKNFPPSKSSAMPPVRAAGTCFLCFWTGASLPGQRAQRNATFCLVFCLRPCLFFIELSHFANQGSCAMRRMEASVNRVIVVPGCPPSQFPRILSKNLPGWKTTVLPSSMPNICLDPWFGCSVPA